MIVNKRYIYLFISGVVHWLIDSFFSRFHFQKCTYIEIDSIPKTYSVILSKPVWMWGAEMGSNEHGVCIGNEAIWNRLINDEKDLNKKLLGMDLVRLGLERSRTALEAMDVITKLLKDYGQGGPCSNTQMDFFYHNGFLIADPNEAWIIETVDSEYVEPIHRLDQETVGLLIVAKNPLMKKILDRMLEYNEITRIYKANVKALLPIKPQTIDMPIGKDKFHSNKRRISNTGQRAITHIIDSKMIKEGVCQLDIKLDTGRTHQIRVHLAEIGHPVIGDPLYGTSTLRQLELNSHQIEFTHPLTQEIISVSLDDK